MKAPLVTTRGALFIENSDREEKAIKRGAGYGSYFEAVDIIEKFPPTLSSPQMGEP